MWQPTSVRRLRHETHQILDAMLALATGDDVLRFDLALQEIGESRLSHGRLGASQDDFVDGVQAAIRSQRA